MDLPALHEEFLAYLEIERNYSPLTVTAYRSDFRLLLRYLEASGMLREVASLDRHCIRGYIAWMRGEELQPSSIARRLNSLRSFWKYLRDNEYASHDPFPRVSIPKSPKHLPHYLSASQCEALLEAATEQRSVEQAFRDKAVLSVMILQGLRRGEVLGLGVGDVHLEQQTVRVESGKGNKRVGVLPLSGPTAEALRDWLELRGGCRHEYLFTARDGRRLGRKGLRGILRRALTRAGLQEGRATPHTLRHSFACLMLRGGCDLFSLSQFLGHTRLDTTAVYLHATVEDLRAQLPKHPLQNHAAATNGACGGLTDQH